MFTDCQSGVIPGDSCISQLLSVTQEIHRSFNCNPPEDVRGMFVDIFKAFDKVWHEGLIFKLKTYDVERKLIMLLENYLKNRNQRVVLNGLNSSWNTAQKIRFSIKDFFSKCDQIRRKLKYEKIRTGFHRD